MQASSWKALLRLIPPSQRENLLLTTANGREIAIQGVVRVEEEYLVVRGRITGTSEVGGGFYFVPYEQITYLGFMRPVQEAEVLGMFGQAVTGHRGSEAETVRDDAPDSDDGTEPATDAPAEPAATPRPPVRAPGKISTADLLKSLRERRMGRDPNRPSSTSG